MIVTMKKVSLVILKNRKEKELRRLKKLGMVHIDGFRGTSEGTNDIEELKDQLERALFSLENPEKGIIEEGSTTVALEKAKEINLILDRIQKLNDENNLLDKEIDRVAHLGDFDPAELLKLREEGLDIRLFSLNKEETAKLDLENSFFVSRAKTGNTLAVVLKEDQELPEFQPVEIPSMGLNLMKEKRDANAAKLGELKDQHKDMSRYTDLLQNALSHMVDEFGFEQVKAGMGEDESLAYLTGWIPASGEDELKEASSKNGWACLIKNAEENEEPPTLVKNNRVIKIIKPIFDFLGTVPGYREYDVSFYFLVFFTLFVGMIIGDAGYGSILFIIGVLAAIKLKAVPDALKLLMVLSLAAVGWGAITGTWFSSASIMKAPFLQSLVIKPIALANPESGKVVMYISFIIGLIHLTIAHLKNVIKMRRSIVVLADVGWLALVIGLFFLVLNLVLDPVLYPMPPFALPLIGGGFAFLIIFGQQQKGQNFFKGILMGIAGLLTTFLDVISCFGDIISYIRLYAVGLATVAISQTFNGMAAGMIESGAVGVVLAVLVLTLGHTLNVVMAILSVVVHGVRLNMLEFSGHLNMQWTGYGYEPFSERVEK